MLRGGYTSPLALLGSSYTNALTAAPLLTTAVTASSLSVLSDGLSQGVELRGKNVPASWDVERSAWQAVWGGAIAGVMLFYWYRLLAFLFPRARTSVTQLVLKVFTNQLIMSPGLNGGFFAFVIFTRTVPKLQMDTEKWSLLAAKYKRDLLPTIMRSCAYWTVVQTINFTVLPAQFTTVSTNFFLLIWTTYLCLIANRKVKKD